jgi:hypothetical protein
MTRWCKNRAPRRKAREAYTSSHFQGVERSSCIVLGTCGSFPHRVGARVMSSSCRARCVELLREGAVEPARERATIQRTRLSSELAPVAKENERRDAADIETARELLLLIRVDFRDL